MRCKSLVLTVCLCLFGLGAVQAEKITIRIGCVAPSNTAYDNAIRKIAAQWAKISNGTIEVIPIMDGKAGTEGDMVRRLNQGNLQGAMMTLAGLAFIDRTLITIAMPLLIQNNDELQYVLDTLKPDLDKILSNKGFMTVAYARGGWLSFMATDPIMLPTDVKNRKLGISDQSKDLFNAFKSMGYNVEAAEIPSTMGALTARRINTIFTEPLIAAGYQWFGIAKYLLNIQISPFIGALIINQATWNKIPAELRPQLMAAAQTVARTELNDAMEQLSTSSFSIMKKNGLVVVDPTPDAREAWRKELEKSKDLTLGTVFDVALYEKIKNILKDRPQGK